MKKVIPILLFFVICIYGYGQVPIINEITPISTYPTNRILIKGSGFVNSPSPVKVWFDQVAGAVISVTEFSLLVDVPNGRLANVQVTNGNGLSAKSPIKFVPVYGGTDFDATKLGTPISISGGSNEVFDVCTCDMDGDGKPDLAGTKQGTAVDIILSRNTGTIGSLGFTSAALATGSPMFNLACGDLDGDGKPELVASRGGTTRNEVFLFRNTSVVGSITFAPATKLFIDASQFAFRISIRDMNLDGKPELIVTNSNVSTGANNIYVFVNQSSVGTVSFNATPIKVPITGATTTYGLDVQDLDGDKRPEIIVNQFNNSDLFIVPNASSGSIVSFGAVQKLTVTGTLNHLTTADFNEDGKLDIAVTSAFDKKVFVLLNTSSGSTISFSTPLAVDTGDGPFGIDVSDIDGDDDVDIIIGNIGISGAGTEISVLKNNGNNSSVGFTTLNINVGKKTRNVRVGDIDGDGKPDIAYTTVTSNSLDIIRNANCFVPQILNLAPLTICAGQTLQLDSKPNKGVTIYDWKESGVSFSSGINSFVSITAAGNYTVTATSESGNCGVSSTSFVVASGSGSLPSDPASANVSSNSPVCTGNPINLSTNLTGSFSYEWSGPNGFTSTQQNPTVAVASLTTAGAYDLRLTNGTCKTKPVSIQVDVANLQNFAITSSEPSNRICAGSTLTLTSNVQPNHTYQWTKDGTDISAQTNSTLSVSQTGTYKVRVTNTILGCSVETNPISVVVVTLPVVDFTVKATACLNEALIFTNTSQVDGAATPTYSWNFGDAGTTTSANTTHTYASAQTFSATLTVSYSNVANCSATKSKSIVVANAIKPVISSTTNSLCNGETASLSVAGTFALVTWNTGATGTPLVVNQQGTYIVNTVDQNGCNSTAQMVIGSKPSPTIVVTADKTELAPGQSSQLLASGADTYVWTPTESLSDATIANPIATPSLTTTYTVSGTVTGGCTAQQSIEIKINSDFLDLKIPNVFSPNGDGVYDVWVIPGIEAYPDCLLAIFDKSGRKILDRKGYQNNWDGIYNGQLLPEGTYYYVFGCPDKKQLTGNVLIAR